MAAPVNAVVQLALDTGNTGKFLQNFTKTVSANTVYDQGVVPLLSFTQTGKYFFSGNNQSVLQTAQNGTSTGFYWLQNPAASTVTAMVRRLSVDLSATAATTMASAPVLSATKFTFTGTASGATASASPYQTAGAANQLIVRTASTGMTVTLANEVGHVQVPALLTAVGQYGYTKEVLAKDGLAFDRGFDLELAPGEGLVVYQSVNGTASDVRVFGIQAEWLEF